MNYGIGYFIDDKENNKSYSIQYDYDDHQDAESRTGYTTEELEDHGISQIFRMDYSAPIENQFNQK